MPTLYCGKTLHVRIKSRAKQLDEPIQSLVKRALEVELDQPLKAVVKSRKSK